MRCPSCSNPIAAHRLVFFAYASVLGCRNCGVPLVLEPGNHRLIGIGGIAAAVAAAIVLASSGSPVGAFTAMAAILGGACFLAARWNRLIQSSPPSSVGFPKIL